MYITHIYIYIFLGMGLLNMVYAGIFSRWPFTENGNVGEFGYTCRYMPQFFHEPSAAGAIPT